VGAGLFGTLSPDDWLWEVKYEAYVTSGFNGLSRDPAEAAAINRDEGFREARAHEGALGTNRFGDINNAFAGVGRVSVSPTLGSEIGISGHTGAYDEAGNNNATIAAIDGLYTFRQFHIGKVPVEVNESASSLSSMFSVIRWVPANVLSGLRRKNVNAAE
jgi:hypothetical protein